MPCTEFSDPQMLDTEFSDQQMSTTKTMSGPQIISTVNQWSDYWFFMSCTETNNWHNSTVSNVCDSQNKCTLLNP